MPASKPKRPSNLSLAPARVAFGHQNTELTKSDPLDGLLASCPNLDKKALRKAQQEARLAR